MAVIKELSEISQGFQGRVTSDIERYGNMPRPDGNGGLEYIRLDELTLDVDEAGVIRGYDSSGELVVLGVSNTKIDEVSIWNNLSEEACAELGNFTWYTLQV